MQPGGTGRRGWSLVRREVTRSGDQKPGSGEVDLDLASGVEKPGPDEVKLDPARRM